MSSFSYLLPFRPGIGNCAQICARGFLWAGVFDFFQVGIETLCGLFQIFLVGDVVPLKNASGLVTADLHGNRFRDAGADQIPDPGASWAGNPPPGDDRGATGKMQGA